jgi:hypothetical protein
MEVDERYAKLEAEIDAEFDARIAQLEEERKRRHEALILLWPSIVATFGHGVTATVLNQDASASNNGALNDKRKPFPMRQAIRSIIDRLEDNAEFNQPSIYDELLKSNPELKESPPPNIRAQIASVLNWLTHKEKVIAVAKEGRGSVPNVYRKRPYEEQLAEEIFGKPNEKSTVYRPLINETAEGVNK